MTTLIFVLPNNTQVEIDAANGSTVKDVAVDNGIPGIIAECGGQCVCGTCHAFVEEGRYQSLPAPSEYEQELIEGAMEHRPNSRLTCQLLVTDDMDGMRFTIPESLY